MKFSSKKNYYLTGFTLIELLVVLTVIGLLVTAATVSYTSTIKRNRDTRRRQDLALMRDIIESYRANFGFYPSSVNATTSVRLALGDCQMSGLRQSVIDITPGLSQANYQYGKYYIPKVVPGFANNLPIDPQNNPPPNAKPGTT